MCRLDEIDFTNLIAKHDIIEKLYDNVRVVDPRCKTVIYGRDKQAVAPGTSCYDFWNKGRVCENCVSIRACLTGEPYYKMECLDDQIYLTMAIPLEYDDERLAIEILKNVTGSIVGSGTDFALMPEVMQSIDKLNGSAVCDPLTGAFNSTFLSERAAACFDDRVGRRQNMTLLFVDIDELKAVNAAYGRQVGDFVLVQIAQIIKGIIRPSDWLIRCGDEFMVILFEMQRRQAEEYIAEILRATAGLLFATPKRDIRVSVSIGMVCCDTPERPGFKECIRLAQKDMAERRKMKLEK